MPKYDSPLNNIKIASPCSANWNEMYGNDRKRFCGDCKLNVFNLSGMTKYDAENLLMNSEGRLCVRYFQRSDGTTLTTDCPVGWAKVKQRLSLCATAVFSMMFTLFGGLFVVSVFNKKTQIMGSVAQPDIRRSIPQTGNVTMGVMANVPVPTPTPKRKPEPRALMGDVVVGKAAQRPS